jgi:type VII secretion protein EccE
MKNPSSFIGVRITSGHLQWTAVLIPAVLVPFVYAHLTWLAIVLSVLILLATTVTVRSRCATGWIAAVIAWRRRRASAPIAPSEPAVGATVMPGDPVAVRWQGEHLVSIIELVAHPFTPTVIVSGKAFTDDVLDTRLVEQIVATHGPDLEADVVSAGCRVGRTAQASLVALYDQLVGPYPAPANRRTWIMLRANPERTRHSAVRRGHDVAGLAHYLVVSTTRVADHLAANGIDARCARSFDAFDLGTAVSFEREAWSVIKGRGTFTAAYTAPGGPDVWWSARADHTITRVRVGVGTAPTTTVLLTTVSNPATPHGFSRLFGGQRAALQGMSPTTDRHYELPIGSAGILVGETADRYPVYMPFDDVDACINLGDARLFTQFVIRSAAAGGVVTLGPQFRNFAELIGARVGVDATIAWPKSTTYLGPREGVDRVTLRQNFIDTPRHRRLPIRLINPREESRYQMTLEH